jgi:hypothetical protein
VLADDRVDERALADVRPTGKANQCAAELHPVRVRQDVPRRPTRLPFSTLLIGVP